MQNFRSRQAFLSLGAAVIAWGVAVAARPSDAVREAPKAPAAAAFFKSKIRPGLAESCVKCHGANKSRGGLRLDSRAGLLKGGESGPVVVPSDSGDADYPGRQHG